mmetsp:Transcript_58992/g.132045  ORF Transcript_58992/g.132045 Transcript_58992/m.132045 type:complete len:557 (-) Transcript_58992:65-1735(-)
MPPRQRWDASEDAALREWVAKHPGWPTLGEKLWKAAAAACISLHSWQSMRERWRKKVEPANAMEVYKQATKKRKAEVRSPAIASSAAAAAPAQSRLKRKASSLLSRVALKKNTKKWGKDVLTQPQAPMVFASTHRVVVATRELPKMLPRLPGPANSLPLSDPIVSISQDRGSPDTHDSDAIQSQCPATEDFATAQSAATEAPEDPVRRPPLPPPAEPPSQPIDASPGAASSEIPPAQPDTQSGVTQRSDTEMPGSHTLAHRLEVNFCSQPSQSGEELTENQGETMTCLSDLWGSAADQPAEDPAPAAEDPAAQEEQASTTCPMDVATDSESEHRAATGSGKRRGKRRKVGAHDEETITITIEPDDPVREETMTCQSDLPAAPVEAQSYGTDPETEEEGNEEAVMGALLGQDECGEQVDPTFNETLALMMEIGEETQEAAHLDEPPSKSPVQVISSCSDKENCRARSAASSPSVGSYAGGDDPDGIFHDLDGLLGSLDSQTMKKTAAKSRPATPPAGLKAPGVYANEPPPGEEVILKRVEDLPQWSREGRMPPTSSQ